ncbi:MAG: helix-turn-helix domain-containing protein [Parvibaculum sp.]|nr:helix-turn-helix domain-containing protein [Parvibaculum sp.]
MDGTIGDIGERLRRARQSAGLDLRRIADATGVSALDLQAIEAEQTDLLPALPQALGLIQTYADYLAIDLDEELSHLRDGMWPGTAARAEPGAPAPKPSRKPSLPWGGAISAGVLFVSTAFALSFIFQDRFSIAIEGATAAPSLAPAPVAKHAEAGMMSASSAAAEEIGLAGAPTILSVPASVPPDESDGAVQATVEMETGAGKPPAEIPVARPPEPRPLMASVSAQGQADAALPKPRPAHRSEVSSELKETPPPEELITGSILKSSATRNPPAGEMRIEDENAGKARPDQRYATSSVFVRSSPDKSSRAITSLGKCETVDLVGTDKAGYWMEVRRAGGASGWVYRGFLSKEQPSSCT